VSEEVGDCRSSGPTISPVSLGSAVRQDPRAGQIVPARKDLVGIVVAVCSGPGGIPKQSVEMAHVSIDGLDGDRHRSRFHGGQNRAVCLFSIEDYRSLQRDRVVCEPPGAFGENVLTEGLDFTLLRVGNELTIGDEVRIAIHDVREPCGTLKSVDKRFPDLMLGRSGFVCRVVEPGILRPGMSIRPGSSSERA
jgi:MOSC domain-containing protein YiiM